MEHSFCQLLGKWTLSALLKINCKEILWNKWKSMRRGNTLWPQGKHFVERVILHSPVTVIGRGRNWGRKSYSFRGSAEILEGKNVFGGVTVLRQRSLAQKSVEQWNIILLYINFDDIFIAPSRILFMIISSHSCNWLSLLFLLLD